MNWWIHSGKLFVGSCDSPWVEFSWITGPDLDPTSFPGSLISPTPGARETLGTRLISIIQKGTTLKLACKNPWRSVINHSFSMSVSLCACLPTCVPAWLAVRLSVCLPFHQSICLSLHLSVCPFICLSVCLSACLSVNQSVYLLVSLCLCVCPSVCLSVILSLSLSVPSIRTPPACLIRNS